jgi:NTP pyrophosphatase (non-canonical NTP hydrolase)
MSERDDLNEQLYHEPPSLKVAEARDAYVMREHIREAGFGFQFLLDTHRTVSDAWGRTVDPTDDEDVSRHVREVVLAATDELHEVLGEVHWKPWKDKRGIKDVNAYREEMADVLHFVIELYMAAGLSGRDIIMDFMTKHYENVDRTKSAEYRAS